MGDIDHGEHDDLSYALMSDMDHGWDDGAYMLFDEMSIRVVLWWYG